MTHFLNMVSFTQIIDQMIIIFRLGFPLLAKFFTLSCKLFIK